MALYAKEMVIIDLNELLFPSFYQLFSDLMREGYGQFPPKLQKYFLEHDYTPAIFKTWIDRNFRKILLAVDDTNVVRGFIIGDHSFGGVAFISWFGIAKDHRRQGIGSKLLESYIDYARSINAHLIELYTYNGALGFYTRFGFKKIGEREQGFFGQKNLIMNLKLKDYNIEELH